SKQIVALRAAVDTGGWSAERDSAQASLTAADSELVQARNRVADYDREATRARELATMNAPPLALLASALVFGIVFGFGAAHGDGRRERDRRRRGGEHWRHRR